MHDVRDREQLAPRRVSAFASIDSIRCRDHSRGGGGIQSVLDDEVAVGFKELAFVRSQPMTQAINIHGRGSFFWGDAALDPSDASSDVSVRRIRTT